jgi:2-methylisocitrate lyase-like PEP mutase family enzyme
MTQSQKADLFRSLHHSSKTLFLPNVWDAASARVIAGAGFPAVATSSAGVAFALGYPMGSGFRARRCWTRWRESCAASQSR